MDEIWVPTEFHSKTFIDSGVVASKVHIVPEPVDVAFFNPTAPSNVMLQLPIGQSVGGQENARPLPGAEEFRFLSVFKWEHRKGWDILLRAFVESFATIDSANSNVVLYLLVHQYHQSENLRELAQTFIKQVTPAGYSPPPVRIIDYFLTPAELRWLYNVSDAFVLPSRGEGWGRPHVEAMSMGLPVIATNWSGPTAFLNADNGYPIPIHGLETVLEGAFSKFHRWARPSLKGLKHLMQYVVNNYEEAEVKGRSARRDMVERFRPEVVADVVLTRLHAIQDILEETEDF